LKVKIFFYLLIDTSTASSPALQTGDSRRVDFTRYECPKIGTFGFLDRLGSNLRGFISKS